MSEAFAESRTFLFFKPPRRVLRVTLRVGHRRARYERGRHVTPAVRPTARARARIPKRRNTPAQKIVLEQVSSPTEVSKRAGLIAFVPHSGMFSFRCLFSARAVGQNRKSAFLERREKRALDRSGGRSSDGGAASPPSPPPARAPPPPPCGQK